MGDDVYQRAYGHSGHDKELCDLINDEDRNSHKGIYDPAVFCHAILSGISHFGYTVVALVRFVLSDIEESIPPENLNTVKFALPSVPKSAGNKFYQK